MAKDFIHLDNIDKYNKLYGLETLHPLASVADLTKATRTVNHVTMRYGLYALYLKHGTQCSLRYGRQQYDYQEGTIVSFAPGQVVSLDTEKDEIRPRVYGLLFHPDLIHGTPLAKHITQYSFFSYDQTEALHLSEREQQMIVDILQNIHTELQYPIDHHSQNILVDRIKLVLDYCLRFYDRQFITRHRVNSDILANFERNINEYFASGKSELNGLPTVAYFAEKACLSSGYFGDLVKKETGQSAQQYIHQHIINRSKSLLLDHELTISQIASQLGFQYPQHFTRLFKQEVGIPPKRYRLN